MANKYKTLPIGTIFTYYGNTYQVCEYDTAFIVSCCALCAFGNINCDVDKSVRGNCCKKHRSDYRQVYFKLIENIKDMNNFNTVAPTFATNTSLNDLQIDCPKGYSIDINNSDLSKGIIKFKKDNITLGDIYENQGRDTFVTNIVVNNKNTYNKILAIAQLMDIASYYNVNWKPDWNNKDRAKYSIIYDNYKNNYVTSKTYCINDGLIYFNNERDAQAVIDNPNFRDILDTIYKD